MLLIFRLFMVHIFESSNFNMHLVSSYLPTFERNLPVVKDNFLIYIMLVNQTQQGKQTGFDKYIKALMSVD